MCGNPVTVDTDSLEARYVVLDVETTGLDAWRGDEICEIAALTVEGELTGRCFTTLVNPGRPIPPEATAINGITDDMVREAPAISAVAPALIEFLGRESVLVVHNAPFDLGFLQSALKRLSLPPIENLVVDTLELARRYFGRGGNSLGLLAQRLSLARGTAHRAMGDTETAARVFLHFRDRTRREGGLTLRALGARPAWHYSGLPAGPGDLGSNGRGGWS